MTSDPGNVQEQDEKKKHHSQHRCRRSCHFFIEDTGSSRKEGHANKVRPKQPTRHPRGHQSRHESAIHEMLHPEHDQGNGNEKSPERLALFHNGEACRRPHSAATTSSSLQELARRAAFNRASHPRPLGEGGSAPRQVPRHVRVFNSPAAVVSLFSNSVPSPTAIVRLRALE